MHQFQDKVVQVGGSLTLPQAVTIMAYNNSIIYTFIYAVIISNIVSSLIFCDKYNNF